jgi:hypothetical protein
VPRYAVTALLATGQTGIVQGVEYGVDEKIEFIKRQPIKKFKNNPFLISAITRLNNILKTYPAFQDFNNIKFVDSNHGGILAALRQDQHSLAAFLIIVNLATNASYEITVALADHLPAQKFILSDLFQEKSNEKKINGVLKEKIEPCGVRVYQIMY